MITVTSTFAATPRGLADSNGPYAGDAATPIALVGGPNEAVRNYAWETGDGALETVRVAQHTYARAGTYVASLATTVTSAGGVRSRELARVKVRPVAPRVDAGPDREVAEGAPYRLL